MNDIFIHANGKFHPFIRNCEQEWVEEGQGIAISWFPCVFLASFSCLGETGETIAGRPAGRLDFVASTGMVEAVGEEQHRMSCLKQN